MQATETRGVWKETISDSVTILYDTTRTPERISIQKKGNNPVHIDCESITIDRIVRAQDMAKMLVK